MRLLELENVNTPALDQIMNPALKQLDKVFTLGKHDIRIVGGAVRDIALGKVPKDIDLATVLAKTINEITLTIDIH